MRLFAIGDSFTYGEELEDPRLSWPYLLGKKLNYTVSNFGQPASGNTRMVRTVVDEINDHDIFIIAWSHWARIEFSDEYGTFDTWPGHQTLAYKSLAKHREFLTEYLTNHFDDEYLFKQYLINIILLQTYLKSHDKKYIMLSSFGNVAPSPMSMTMINQIDFKRYIGWPLENMQTWTWKAGAPKGPKGHFLEQGHQVVSEKIYEHIRHLGWVS